MAHLEKQIFNNLNKHTKVRNKTAPRPNSEIKKEMSEKKAIKSGSQNDWSTFKKARNAVNYSTRCAKSESGCASLVYSFNFLFIKIH